MGWYLLAAVMISIILSFRAIRRKRDSLKNNLPEERIARIAFAVSDAMNDPSFIETRKASISLSDWRQKISAVASSSGLTDDREVLAGQKYVLWKLYHLAQRHNAAQAEFLAFRRKAKEMLLVPIENREKSFAEKGLVSREKALKRACEAA